MTDSKENCLWDLKAERLRKVHKGKVGHGKVFSVSILNKVEIILTL